jgi:general secretion pathway protein G
MTLRRSAVGLATIALAVLLAQSPNETRAKEAALKTSLFTLRTAIDMYTFDEQEAPHSLGDLISEKYLRSIPVDPMTGSNSSWRIVKEDPAKSADRNKQGIFDVHSSSKGVSSDGTRYADW